ncbi:MAG: hypothetical protein L3J65_10830 [Robiginitomaculum sp.]|nr:hypothetical protein [Robiginitomaculum sp.]
MRGLISVTLGLTITLVAAPAWAGTLADYTAKPGKFKVENGVRVFRIKPTKAPEYQNQASGQYQQALNHRAQGDAVEHAFERGYDAGFEAGFDKASKKPTPRRNRYNYGRRYSTSGFNPRYSRFRSNISYGRPAYVSRARKKKN